MAIRPILTYASPIFTLSNTLKNRLASAEGKFLRRITGAPKQISHAKLCKDLNIIDINTFMAKLSSKFYKDAKTCNTSDFHKILDIELFDDNTKFSSVTAFLLSDATLSKHYK